MLDGKKGTAQKIVYGAFEQVAEKTGKDAMEVFEAAMGNIMPVLEVKARRIGGATYQVPIEVRAERRQALALRWMTLFSRKRGEKTQIDRLAGEIIDASNNSGNAVKRKEDMHKMAEANKAFAHFSIMRRFVVCFYHIILWIRQLLLREFLEQKNASEDRGESATTVRDI